MNERSYSRGSGPYPPFLVPQACMRGTEAGEDQLTVERNRLDGSYRPGSVTLCDAFCSHAPYLRLEISGTPFGSRWGLLKLKLPVLEPRYPNACQRSVVQRKGRG